MQVCCTAVLEAVTARKSIITQHRDHIDSALPAIAPVEHGSAFVLTFYKHLGSIAFHSTSKRPCTDVDVGSDRCNKELPNPMLTFYRLFIQ